MNLLRTWLTAFPCSALKAAEIQTALHRCQKKRWLRHGFVHHLEVGAIAEFEERFDWVVKAPGFPSVESAVKNNL